MITNAAVRFARLMMLGCAFFGTPALAAETTAGGDTNLSKCDEQAAGGDRRNIVCSITDSMSERRVQFIAKFSGGHDDTMASMSLSFDGAPLTCDPGSKTDLMGEDGDVILECKFFIAPNSGKARVLRAEVKWSHTEYSGFDLITH